MRERETEHKGGSRGRRRSRLPAECGACQDPEIKT